MGFAGWVPARKAGALRPRVAEGPGQRGRSSAETGRLVCLPVYRGPGGRQVERFPHPETLSSLDLFCFSAFSLLFQTCLFLLRTSQLLHPSLCLQDHREARQGSAAGELSRAHQNNHRQWFSAGKFERGGGISLCCSISL